MDSDEAEIGVGFIELSWENCGARREGKHRGTSIEELHTGRMDD